MQNRALVQPIGPSDHSERGPFSSKEQSYGRETDAIFGWIVDSLLGATFLLNAIALSDVPETADATTTDTN
jgi:hypothetical protein